MKKIVVGVLAVMVLGFLGIIGSMRADPPPMPDKVVINDAVSATLELEDSSDVVQVLVDRVIAEYEVVALEQKDRDLRLLVILAACLGVAGAVSSGVLIYAQRSILRPFRNLQGFARQIAMGNLDLPLGMDRHSRFGAFTESFDLMRDELRTARENERAADRSKKELVAALSHDIKTPVASIKAATEVMLVTVSDDREKTQLERISEKADQINTLVTDMFHSTLEELQVLTVTPVETSSAVVTSLIRSADFAGRVGTFEVPGCIIIADSVRLGQVFDNIIGNSYKYADTAIVVDARIAGAYLEITIRDFGPGVDQDELPLIVNKFYRGENATTKSGYGMGLYIAKDLTGRMSGVLDCENSPDGFVVRVLLKLASA